jgi:hypothetical protein
MNSAILLTHVCPCASGTYHYSDVSDVLYCSRFRIDSLERLLHIADSFVWEDMPITDSLTGSLTVARWIPRIEALTKRLINTTIIFHFSYAVVKRIASAKPQLSLNSWYPFEITNTFVFDLVNASQVK